MLLHGILEYSAFRWLSRPNPQNLEVSRRFATLSNVQEPITPTIEPFAYQPAAPIVPIQPSPNNPPWNGWVAVGIWALSVVLTLIVPLVFVVPYVLAKGIDLSDRTGRLQNILLSDPVAIALQLGPIVLAHGITLLVCWWVVTQFSTFSFREMLGWKMNGYRWWHSIIITFFFYGLAIGLTYIFGDVESAFDQLLKSSRLAVYLTVVFATFTAPLVEEVVYRGLLYSAFQRRFGVTTSVVIVTMLFTAVHIPQYSFESTPDPAPLITLFALSLTLTLVRARTENLLPCIVLHTVFNGIQSVLIILRPYIESFLQPYMEKSADHSVTALFRLLI